MRTPATPAAARRGVRARRPPASAAETTCRAESSPWARRGESGLVASMSGRSCGLGIAARGPRAKRSSRSAPAARRRSTRRVGGRRCRPWPVGAERRIGSRRIGAWAASPCGVAKRLLGPDRTSHARIERREHAEGGSRAETSSPGGTRSWPAQLTSSTPPAPALVRRAAPRRAQRGCSRANRRRRRRRPRGPRRAARPPARSPSSASAPPRDRRSASRAASEAARQRSDAVGAVDAVRAAASAGRTQPTRDATHATASDRAAAARNASLSARRRSRRNHISDTLGTQASSAAPHPPTFSHGYVLTRGWRAATVVQEATGAASARLRQGSERTGEGARG